MSSNTNLNQIKQTKPNLSGKLDIENRYIIFQLNNEYLSLNVDYVREIIEVSKIREIPKLSAKFEGIIHLREQIIPVLNFDYCIFSKSNFEDLEIKQKLRKVIILKTSSGEFGILVDAIRDIITFTEENFESIPSAVPTEIPISFIQSICQYDDQIIKILHLPRILSSKFGLSEFASHTSSIDEEKISSKMVSDNIYARQSLALSPEQKDALKEVSNIASGKAVTAISDLMKSKSKIDILVKNVLVQELFALNHQDFEPKEVIIGIRALLKNDLNGVIFLLFSIDELKFLVEQISDVTKIPNNILNVNDLDEGTFSAFQEIGNIIISHYAAAISDLLRIDLYHEVPEIVVGEYNSLIDIELAKLSKYSDQAIFLQTNIRIQKKRITGDIIFIPYYDSIDQFINWVNEDHVVDMLDKGSRSKKVEDTVKVSKKKSPNKSKRNKARDKKVERKIEKEVFNKIGKQSDYKIEEKDQQDLKITESDLNAFQELGNIAAGNAGNALSQMLNKKVYLEIPPVKILNLDDLISLYNKNETLLGYISTTKGFFESNIFLLYQPEDIENLLAELMDVNKKNQLKKESDLSKPEKSCIEEISSILISHYISAISDFLKVLIEPPKFQFFFGASKKMFQNFEFSDKSNKSLKAILVETNIQVAQEETIKGNFVLLLSAEIMKNVLNRIAEIW